MTSPDDAWLVALTAGMALSVVGVTALETAAWFVQYGALGAGLGLALFSLYLGTSEPDAG